MAMLNNQRVLIKIVVYLLLARLKILKLSTWPLGYVGFAIFATNSGPSDWSRASDWSIIKQSLYVINTVIDIDYFYYCYWLLMIPIIIKQSLYVINTVIDIDYFYYSYWLLMIPIIIKQSLYVINTVIDYLYCCYWLLMITIIIKQSLKYYWYWLLL